MFLTDLAFDLLSCPSCVVASSSARPASFRSPGAVAMPVEAEATAALRLSGQGRRGSLRCGQPRGSCIIVEASLMRMRMACR
ncbi:hypothetical protein EJB05_54468, partial [Eragrostis curvula]